MQMPRVVDSHNPNITFPSTAVCLIRGMPLMLLTSGRPPSSLAQRWDDCGPMYLFLLCLFSVVFVVGCNPKYLLSHTLFLTIALCAVRHA